MECPNNFRFAKRGAPKILNFSFFPQIGGAPPPPPPPHPFTDMVYLIGNIFSKHLLCLNLITTK